MVFALTTFSLVSLAILSFVQAQSNGGFSIELIHRDSPKSPFYNPSQTPFERVNNALSRSFNRVNHFSPILLASSVNDAQSEIISSNGEYIINVSIGTPPVSILSIADTGSDLIWTQCAPCSQCYKQKAPLFDPQSSSTYKDVSCDSTTCLAVEGSGCGNDDQTCQYTVSYGDRSFSKGNIATDTLSLVSTSGKEVAFRKTLFGCGHNNDGTFSDAVSGIVGLGGGNESLVSQLGSSADGKFSYCLIPVLQEGGGSTSKIKFGSDAKISGRGVVSTPLVRKTPNTFYFLTLEAVSVDGERIDFNSDSSSSSASEGNIIIDSGTTLTFLPEDVYSRVESAVAKKIDQEQISQPGFSLCYQAGDHLNVPKIVVHFSGADLELKAPNTFLEVSEGVACFTFSPFQLQISSSVQGIFGNLAQTNFLVAYDLEAETVSFKPTDCSQQ